MWCAPVLRQLTFLDQTLSARSQQAVHFRILATFVLQGAHDAIAQVIGFIDGSIIPDSPPYTPERDSDRSCVTFRLFSDLVDCIRVAPFACALVLVQPKP